VSSLRRSLLVVPVLAALLVGCDEGGSSEADVPVDPGLQVVIDAGALELDAYWGQALPAMYGVAYSPPAEVLRFDAAHLFDTACGPLQAPNAFYCPGDQRVYWDVGWWSGMYARDPSFPLVILAHEWGHRIQHIAAAQMAASPGAQAGELQADCFAGAFFQHAYANLGLSADQAASGAGELFRIGDPQALDWFDEGAHGHASQRALAYQMGFLDIGLCREFERDHVEPPVQLGPAYELAVFPGLTPQTDPSGFVQLAWPDGSATMQVCHVQGPCGTGYGLGDPTGTDAAAALATLGPAWLSNGSVTVLEVPSSSPFPVIDATLAGERYRQSFADGSAIHGVLYLFVGNGGSFLVDIWANGAGEDDVNGASWDPIITWSQLMLVSVDLSSPEGV
jgi:hypothetical protein